ncbi:MAG: hypothetical protein J3K34DRAFT_400333 [Monoraphidium minutum]|nr:MAG: hypothetical protein J3K34DRAFT_400333 [Monoraphidium minutum]
MRCASHGGFKARPGAEAGRRRAPRCEQAPARAGRLQPSDAPRAASACRRAALRFSAPRHAAREHAEPPAAAARLSARGLPRPQQSARAPGPRAAQRAGGARGAPQCGARARAPLILEADRRASSLRSAIWYPILWLLLPILYHLPRRRARVRLWNWSPHSTCGPHCCAPIPPPPPLDAPARSARPAAGGRERAGAPP